MECCSFGGQMDHTDVRGDDDGNDDEEDGDDDDGNEKEKDEYYNAGEDDGGNDDNDDDDDDEEYDEDDYVTADEGDEEDVWVQDREEEDPDFEAVEVDSGGDSDEVGHHSDVKVDGENSVDARGEEGSEEDVEENCYHTGTDATNVIVDTVHHKDYREVNRETDKLMQQILKCANISPLPCAPGGSASGSVDGTQVQGVPATLDCFTATQAQDVPATLERVTAIQEDCVPGTRGKVGETQDQSLSAAFDHVTATQEQCVSAPLYHLTPSREQSVPATSDYLTATQEQRALATLDHLTAIHEQGVSAILGHVTAKQKQCVPATLDCVTATQEQSVPATLDCVTATQEQSVPATLDCVTATQEQCVPTTTTDKVMTTEGENVITTQCVPASIDKFMRAEEHDLQANVDRVMASEGQCLPSTIGHLMASHEQQLHLRNGNLKWPTAISNQTVAGTVQYNFIKMEQQVVVPKARNLNIGGTQNIGKPAQDQVDEETPLTLVQKIRSSSAPPDFVVAGYVTERTEARIRTWTENTVETAVFKKVRDTLDNGASWVTIHGPPGEGKSTVAYMTLKDQYSKGRQVFQVESPSEFSDVTMTSSRPLIMLDDILGDLEFSVVEWSMWRQVLRSFLDPISFKKRNTTERRKKVTVLFVGRDYILQSASADLGRLTTFMFHDENTVHISSGRDVEEKIQLWNAVPELRCMDFEREKVKAICETNCPYGFPHVCKLFITAYHHDNKISAEEYFTKPVEFLNQTIKKIVQDKAKRRLFMAILKRNGKVTEKELDDDDDYAGYDCISAANHLIGSYLKREDGTYMFAHPSIHDITSSLLIRK